MTTRGASRALLAAASVGPVAEPSGKPEPTPRRTISVDVDKVRGPHNKAFRFCVGAGRAAEGLRADWQEQLTVVRRECGFRYLRFHGLLHDDMGVYREDRDGHAVYNWQYVDKLYDAILATGMKPFVELGFMPAALASGTKTIFWWKGNITPPKSYDRWEALIEALTRHLEDRYGRSEVKTWYFEVWNEANIEPFWTGSQADYFRLYAHASAAIKRVCPLYRVGGPATAAAAWVPDFLRHCSENRLPVDFVSTHSYDVDGFVDEYGEQQQRLIRGRDNVGDDMLRVAREIATSPFPGIELHFTEWSASYSSRDPVHDHYYSAPYILSRIKRVAGEVTSLSYWTFTDIFEEGGPGPTPFHGGFGLLNLQGLRKPAFFAFRFLNQLGDTELVNTDTQSWVCRSGDGVQLLLWDLHAPDQGDASNQMYFRRDVPASSACEVAVRVAGLPPGTYDLALTRVGYRSNDVFADYHRLGSPTWLSADQVAQMGARNSGAPVAMEAVTVSAGQVFERTLALQQNDVWLATLAKR